jgi:hypothetical protein
VPELGRISKLGRHNLTEDFLATGYRFSDHNPLNLIKRDLIVPAVAQLGCPRALVCGHLLRVLEEPVLLVDGDASRPE